MEKRKKTEEGSEKITIKVRLDEGAKMPEYAHEGDAGLDLFANESLLLMPMHRAAVGTGIYLELPKGYAALIKDKSGLAIKNGLTVLGGVSDSGYRGEYKVILVNLSSKPFKIMKGMKIAQLLIQKVENVKIEETKELSSSSRGEGRFGSTGLGNGLDKIKKAVS